ncbi:MAG: glycosyltransferase family 2 protein [Nitrososphaerota archaeon]|jgi:glycosyltransferase involved in cell wall biosynthesis|nr:glycosyltransferase family 2 protein [Nitrososphaerota archaeon]MDG7037879.1 glycosyltransferase family 2 protein [Nitrososphaerota archaeon]MDG7042776.1 glycosyltransferase family 2 protein [Nitrososphaerota archaeon]MDG7045376.1 glycosyltransferase family 2 protein [Nitrososphaerota archaeon]
MKQSISVIITAHDRKEYLKDAVNSVLNQTLDRDNYEVIVVKNYGDYDDWLAERRVKSIVTQEVGVGADYVIGAEEAKGDVISFLDDDDLFLPYKLEIVNHVFKNDIIGYHNEMTPVDEGMRPLRLNELRKQAASRLFPDEITLIDAGFISKRPLEIGFLVNSSSVCIRRESLLLFKDALKKVIKNASIDAILILLPLEEGNLAIDNRRLTLFRVHNKSTLPVTVDPTKYIRDRYYYFYHASMNFKILLDSQKFIKTRDSVLAFYIQNRIHSRFMELKGWNTDRASLPTSLKESLYLMKINRRRGEWLTSIGSLLPLSIKEMLLVQYAKRRLIPRMSYNLSTG